VASRGLDVKDVTHVINYSLPRELDSYIHRIGRTARSGKTGLAMNLVTPSHRHLIQKIERFTKSRMKEGVIPNRRDIGMKKIAALLSQFNEQPGFQRALNLMDESWKSAVAEMSPEEVAARFLTMMFPWVFSEKEQPKMARSDAPPTESRSHGQGDRPPRRRDERPHSRNVHVQEKGEAPSPAFASASKAPSKESKQDRRDEKRRTKRDFHKKFKKRFKPKSRD
jgi:ATP-dependent RNA helicase DeaD